MIKQLILSCSFLAIVALVNPCLSQEAAKTTAPAKKTATIAAAKTKVDTLVIEARLVEIPGKFPPNDLYNYVYIMKYRIIKVVKGKYVSQEILVGHYNPLIPRDRIKDKMQKLAQGDVQKFEVGAKHKLVLIAPLESAWKDAVEDEFIDSDLEKYYALKADNLK
ncbi:MAG: hypothetical protein PHC61_03265 [Chitinivibrionales bacterium]|nr:hypothetical protein [Chitinivibrionales bacterium]